MPAARPAAAPPPPPRRRPGGRYILGELLGRGGMAEVFDGRAVGSDGFEKPVAIKRLLPERTGDAQFVERLIAEAKLLVAMQHGNLVAVLDLVRDGGDVFLVMERIWGPTLRQLTAARRATGDGPLPMGLACHVIAAACAGLDFAHRRPTGAIIHADISPSNLLLTDGGEVKVADFGIARREGMIRAVEGKWAYMAPEQARGEPLTVRSDTYALGVVLYELIAGAHPFARPGSRTERDERRVHAVRDPRAIRPDVPAELAALCLRAVAPDPARRFARMAELADALGEVRFHQGWRDGAAELEAIIRAAAGPEDALPVPARGGTVLTGKPLTIFTRSLLAATDDGARLPSPVAGEVMAATRAPAAATRARRGPVAVLGALAGLAIAIGVATRGPGAPAGPAGPASMDDAPRAAAAVVPAVRAPSSPAAPPTAAPPPTTTTIVTTVPVFLPEPSAAPSSAPPPTGPASVAPAPIAASPSPPPAARTSIVHAAPASAPAPRRARKDERARAVAAAAGQLRVASDPWAYVDVAGRRAETPATLELPAGRYRLELENPETGAHQTRWATVRAGKTTTISVELDE